MSNLTCIVADDERHIRMILESILKELGVRVLALCENGAVAVESYKSLKPDLVFLDINMPVLDGMKALSEIVATDQNAHVVMLTSLNSKEVVMNALNGGAFWYILKGTAIDILQASLEESLSEFKKEREQDGWTDVATSAVLSGEVMASLPSLS